MHETNSKAGGFKIIGIATKDKEGNIEANLNFTWNDVIVPNLIYTSDKEKVNFAINFAKKSLE